MSKRMKQIEMLLKAARKMKQIMVLTDANIGIPYALKTKKLELMRQNLHDTQMMTLELMEEEILGSEDQAA